LERATQAVFNFLLQILKETINAKSTFWKGWILITIHYYYYYCAEWGYIGVFIQVLTMYQIHHPWIHPLHCSVLYSLPQFLEQFQQVYIHYLHHIYPLIPFPATSSRPPCKSHPSRHNLFYPPVLWFL
jgi:hypothetical protein